MIKYEELYKEVKEILSKKKFKHSERVIKRLVEYTTINNVDIENIKKSVLFNFL